MADDDPAVLVLEIQHFQRARGDIAVAGAVEAVAADVVLLIIFIGHAVQIGGARHGLMESGVEHGHHWRVGHDRLAGADAHQVGRVVQRPEGDVFLDSVHAGLVDDAGGGELFTAVQHAMAHRADFGNGGNHAVLLGKQGFEHQVHGLGVVLNHFALHHKALVRVFVGELAALDADALHQALGDDGFIVHVDQLILQRG